MMAHAATVTPSPSPRRGWSQSQALEAPPTAWACSGGWQWWWRVINSSTRWGEWVIVPRMHRRGQTDRLAA